MELPEVYCGDLVQYLTMLRNKKAEVTLCIQGTIWFIKEPFSL